MIFDDVLTRRDYYAAHAPAEIPDWFEGPKLESPKPPTRPKEIAEAITKWLEDEGAADLVEFVGSGTLDRALARDWQADWTEYLAKRDARAVDCQSARYFAWRVFYANRMCEAVK